MEWGSNRKPRASEEDALSTPPRAPTWPCVYQTCFCFAPPYLVTNFHVDLLDFVDDGFGAVDGAVLGQKEL